MSGAVEIDVAAVVADFGAAGAEVVSGAIEVNEVGAFAECTDSDALVYADRDEVACGVAAGDADDTVLVYASASDLLLPRQLCPSPERSVQSLGFPTYTRRLTAVLHRIEFLSLLSCLRGYRLPALSQYGQSYLLHHSDHKKRTPEAADNQLG